VLSKLNSIYDDIRKIIPEALETPEEDMTEEEEQEAWELEK
jgi:hypothetical protein